MLFYRIPQIILEPSPISQPPLQWFPLSLDLQRIADFTRTLLSVCWRWGTIAFCHPYSHLLNKLIIYLFRIVQFYLLLYELKTSTSISWIVFTFFCEFADTDSCLTNDTVLLGHDAASLRNWISTFRQNVLPSSRQNVLSSIQQPKHPRHSVTSRKN